MRPPGVDVRGLTVSFPSESGELTVLADYDLSVEPGEFVTIVGPSGCGKSTVLRAIAGLIEPDRGSIRIPGREDHARDVVAWHPQSDSLVPWRRALGNAMLGALSAGATRAEAEARARELLDAFGLAGFERSWPDELSGGMRQRLALARTMLANRPVLVLDEPFGALDALLRREMNLWLAETVSSHTVILVTHDVEEAVLLSDRVVVMSARPGTIVAEFVIEPAMASEPVHRAEIAARILTALGVGDRSENIADGLYS